MVATSIDIMADDGTTPVGNISAVNNGDGTYNIVIEALPATSTLVLKGAAGITATATAGNISATAAAGAVNLTSDGGAVIVPSDTHNLKLATEGVTRVDIDPAGATFMGSGSQNAASTGGFVYIPVIKGPPNGTPSVEYTTQAAVCLDAFTGHLWFRIGGQWRYVPTAARA